MLVRGRLCLAFLMLCAIGFPGPGLALDIQNVKVWTRPSLTDSWTELIPAPPTNTIFVGEYIKLEITLENTTGRLGKMCAIDVSDPYGPNPDYPSCATPDLAYNWCTQNPDPTVYPGQYWVWPQLMEGCGAKCSPYNCIEDPLSPGTYTSYLYPENPLAPVQFVSGVSIDNWDFNGYTFADAGASNNTAKVEWVFQAMRDFTSMDFLVFAHHMDDFGDCVAGCSAWTTLSECPYGGADCDCCGGGDGLYEDQEVTFFCTSVSFNNEGTLLSCTDLSGKCPILENPSPSANAGGPSLAHILQDYWGATINIVSPLKVTTQLHSVGIGTRPPNVAYIGDPIELAASVTNTGDFAVSVLGRTLARLSGDYPSATPFLISKATTEEECGSAIEHYWPVGAQMVSAGAEQTFTWSFTVTSGPEILPPPTEGELFFSPVDMGGAISESPTLFIKMPPLAVTVSLYIDPDGSGPEPATPVSTDGADPTGLLYYMSTDVLEAHIIMENTSDTYSYEVSPFIISSGSAAGSYKKTSGPAIGTAFLAPAPGPGNSMEFVYTYEMDPTSFLATSCAGPGPFDIRIAAGARGVWNSAWAYVSDQPFKSSSNLWYDIIGLSGTSIEVLRSFSVNMYAQNPLGRKIVMNSGTSAILDVSKPPGDSTQWLWESLPPSFAQTWDAGQLRPPFTWKIKPTASGTMYLCAGIKYGPARCVDASAGSARYSGSDAPCNNTRKILVLWPQYLEVLSFTATPTYFFFDGGKLHKLALDMVLFNESMTETIYIDSIKNPCIAEGTNEVGGGANVMIGYPVPSPPFEIPPRLTVPIAWEITSKCDTDRRFGFYDSPACSPLIHGSMLVSSSLIQVADAVTNTITLQDPPKLECSLMLDATEYAEGEFITLYFSVTNTNQNDALDYSVTVTADYMLTPALISPSVWLAEVTSGLSPPDILPGSGLCGVTYASDASMHVYRATFKAQGAGKARFIVSAQCSDIVYKDRPVCERISDPITIKETSAITATAWATATVTMPQTCPDCQVESGCQADGTNCISVGVTVRNYGEVPVDGLSPSVFLSILPCNAGICPLTLSYTGSAVQISSPPAEDLGQALAGYDTTRSFTWTYSPAGIGCLRFKVSVSGTDHETGELRYAEAYTNCVRILPQPPVTLRLLSAPAKVIVGQEFEVQIEIDNPGETPVLLQGGEPSLSFTLLGTDAVATEHFQVLLPPPVTVQPGTKQVVIAKVRVLPTASLGAVRLRVPEGSAFMAVDTITGISWAVRDAGETDPPLIVEVVAAAYALEGADPNPFRPARDGTTLIRFRIPEAGQVQLKIYTISGELVRRIIDEVRPVGYYEQTWDGTNDEGQICASGIYLIRIEGPNFSQVRKLAIIK